ncbi:uncharacterized protein LOC135372434 isoform X1 [Ornithodoros turicata]|uniref:uncharacterized protein LOC135372434 isoform X1 n=1 Tax=Ornithodoros turicata TaxID=34597 RepID=UPI00313A1217
MTEGLLWFPESIEQKSRWMSQEIQHHHSSVVSRLQTIERIISSASEGLPKHNPQQYLQWVQWLEAVHGKAYNYRKSDGVCSLHFEQSSFFVGHHRAKLRPDSCPCIPPTQSQQRKSASVRQGFVPDTQAPEPPPLPKEVAELGKDPQSSQAFFRQHREGEQSGEQADTEGTSLVETGDLETSLRQVSETGFEFLQTSSPSFEVLTIPVEELCEKPQKCYDESGSHSP